MSGRPNARSWDRGPGGAALLALLLPATLLGAVAAEATAQEAVPTRLVVRAVAHDAKIIGSGVGGARITVRDARTGQILARGMQRGGTGDTDRIMREPHRRGGTPYTGEGAASFSTTLMLEEPTPVQVSAEAPLGVPHATRTASKTVLLVPGHDVSGQGLVLTIHGFIVEITSPAPGAAVGPGEEIEVRARVRMMCGCPTRPGGLWDADRYRLRARLVRDGRVVASAPLEFTGETSVYAARLRAPEAGSAVLEVIAADPERANLGRDRVGLTVR